jgi:hypothetical protein
LIWTDGGYAGQFVDWAKHAFGRVIEIVKRPDLHKFVVWLNDGSSNVPSAGLADTVA